MDPSQSQREELAILRGAIENTNQAFITIDENHQVILFNKAAETIFGYSREEIIGKDLDAIMASGCARDHRQAVDQYVRTRIPRRIGHDTELLATRKNKDKFPANISFSVSEVNGKLYFTGIVRDLTETKALQEKITKSERLAALGQAVAEITHEIKNPLMMIGGFARQLLKQPPDEKTASKLNIITAEVLRLESLLNELKQYYQPGELKKEKTDMNHSLGEVLTLVKHDCNKLKVKTIFEKEDKPLYVEGDKDKLKQVILNLLKNAIESMENGGALHIRVEQRNGFIETTIADEGCGIPECDRENIFAPFFTTKQHGTGMGLSISKSIVEAHEGSSFTVASKKGKGTLFKLKIPVFRPK